MNENDRIYLSSVNKNNMDFYKPVFYLCTTAESNLQSALMNFTCTVQLADDPNEDQKPDLRTQTQKATGRATSPAAKSWLEPQGKVTLFA